MPWYETVTLAAYFVTAGLLSVFGAHRLALVLLYYRHRRRAVPLPEPLPDEACPTVLVQLPVFNERFVVERLIDRIAELDWPRDRLRIQVLDDSTDDTLLVSRKVVERHRRLGLDIELVVRDHRAGYKAGALKEGLAHDAQRGAAPFIAMFDADFLPNPDFLRRAIVPLVFDDGVGMVQARWVHLNRDESLLTRAQAVLLDGHFVMEHGARFRSGRFFNFNGTAGIWRREAIDQAGGWQGDTLTEDLDLSYRAQLAGWRFVYLQALEVPAELPDDPRAFKTQQHRWAKGSIQTARKLLPVVWRSNQPLHVKVEATFHMGSNLAYPLMVGLLLLLPLALMVRVDERAWMGLAIDAPVFVLATFNLMVFYAASEIELKDGRWLGRLPLVPFVLGLGASLTPNNARAVWEAVTGRLSPFVRTPKTGDSAPARYRARPGVQSVVEALGGVYYLAAAGFALAHGLWLALPFLLLFAAAFMLLGVGSLLPRRATRAAPARTPAPAGRTPATAPSLEPATLPLQPGSSRPGRTAASDR
jgi:cellulose synthase/poly-beta-1,6-N-acetylglucosamine synthase-like glycosyltransferase